MFAKRLTPQEYWRAGLNMAVAFESAFEFGKEQEKAQTAQTDPKEELYGAFEAQGQPPVASLVMNRKEVRFDGHTVKMGGVGGVATLPAHRRGGAIRACMEQALRDFYQEGYVLSHLYPFSTAYYRQFGFAPAGQSVRWTIKLPDLKRLPHVGGSVRQLFPGDDLSPLLDIYNKMYGDTNFSCLREVFNKDLEGDKPLANKRWIFLWQDEDGTPSGFLVGTRVKDTLHCTPDFSSTDGFLFADTKALIGLLNFVYSAFIANFEEIQFCVPAHMDLTALLPEISGMDCRPTLNGMARAVNAEALLKLCRCKGQGRLILGVSDSIIPENNGRFLLDFAPDRENRVERLEQVNVPADIELDVGNLAVLLGGARDTASLLMTPDIRTNVPLAQLEQVFYRKPCHVLDLY